MDADLTIAPTQRIDLTRDTEVAYWCRVFDVTIPELRDAVHHAGHRLDDVQRYLQQEKSRSRSGS